MFTTRPELEGTFGAVASTHWIASQTAMRILELGGNAFDAACAGAFVLQVVEPHLNGPAGDVSIIMFDAATRKTRVVCGQGTVPAAANCNAFKSLGLDLIPGTGLLAAVVPGAFDAWLLLLRDHGTLPLETVLETAIGYAENGIPVLARMSETIAAAQTMFERHWPTSHKLYMPNGHPPAVGSLFTNVTLAATWKRLLDEASGGSRESGIDAARKAWSQGFVADFIDRFCREQCLMDVSGTPHKAVLRGQDLANWSAHFEEPLSYDYAGHRIVKCGPWSQGPAMLQALALLSGYDMAALPPDHPEFVHIVVEAMKLAFADREAYYGDPDFTNVPMQELLSEEYNVERRRLIGEQASLEWRPGKIDAAVPVFDYEAACQRQREVGLLAAYGGGEPTMQDLPDERYLKTAVGDTSHIDVVDKHGNMVTATPSGGWLQSSPAIPELGFPLGTRAQMSWLDPDSPSSLQPGARPRTTLTPTMVLRDDDSGYIACGTPGGDQQDQWQLIFLLRHFHHGMGFQQAIDAPAFHTEHAPNSFYPRQAAPAKLVLEGRYDAQAQSYLKNKGHDVHVGGDWSEGRLSAVCNYADGKFGAAANPRGMQGYAVCR
ncbi:MAG: gamma-glutamyltransferase family protein [Rhizobiales bacterium]|nr:gamma-glutamyltransferase family protein [Hyphomicrobiales bacterium]